MQTNHTADTVGQTEPVTEEGAHPGRSLHPVDPHVVHFPPAAGPYDALPLKFSVVANVNARTHIDLKAGTWGRLANGLSAPQECSSKETCSLFKLVTFGEKRNANGSLRHNDNVVGVYGLTGDYDAEEISVDGAAARLEAGGIEAVVYTTASHRTDAPRWRVIAPLSGPHAPSEYAALMDKLNGALGGILAGESWTLSQVFYYGRVKGVAYEYRRTRGECIDLVDIEPIGKARAAEAAARPRSDAEVDDLERITAISHFTDTTRAELASALAVIPADERELWVRMGQALKRLGDIGYILWIRGLKNRTSSTLKTRNACGNR